jgi:hypothetical protein
MGWPPTPSEPFSHPQGPVGGGLRHRGWFGHPLRPKPKKDMHQKHNKTHARAVVGNRRTGGAPKSSGRIKDGGMARLAAKKARKSRSGFKKNLI